MGRDISIDVSEYRDTPIDLGLRLGKGYVPFGGEEGQVLTKGEGDKYSWKTVAIPEDDPISGLAIKKTISDKNELSEEESVEGDVYFNSTTNALYIYHDNDYITIGNEKTRETATMDLKEAGLIDPLIDSNNNIYVDSNDTIYTL